MNMDCALRNERSVACLWSALPYLQHLVAVWRQTGLQMKVPLRMSDQAVIWASPKGKSAGLLHTKIGP